MPWEDLTAGWPSAVAASAQEIWSALSFGSVQPRGNQSPNVCAQADSLLTKSQMSACACVRVACV